MKNNHWIQGDGVCEAPLFRRSFLLEHMPKSAVMEICGLGYFLLYVNGKRVGNEEFMPAVSNYSSVLGCETAYPVWEERVQYRCLYKTFDLLPYLHIGENVIGMELGNGWYHQTRRIDEGQFVFGHPKLRYEVRVVDEHGQEIFLESDKQTLWKPSEVIENNLFYGETHDLRLRQEDWCIAGADVSSWNTSRPVHGPEAILTEQQGPGDRELRVIIPNLLRENEKIKVYDCGENIAGWVSICCTGKEGERVSVRYSEELQQEGDSLDFASTGGQKQIQEDCYICSGSPVVVHPKFCWHGFRYFEVMGSGEVVSASLVCSDTPVISSFQCSDPVLNWLYEAYIRTQINNFHNAIPSDCPHREKLGYTGDGHLTSEVAMLLLDTKELYKKWYQDILDSQGVDTGHIPHTAPFFGGGGGPGGWGCAVYVIPMNYYKVYGDNCLLKMGYEPILCWLQYMNTKCENGLVIKEEDGGWCLGEWCAPTENEEKIPEPFVNTYFYILGLEAMKEIAFILQKKLPVWVDKRLQISKQAIISHYYNEETGDFCCGVAAANAYALNIGMGTPKTKESLIKKYTILGRFDTGIFGTPILIERLFLEGEGNLAFALLTNKSHISFTRMMQAGATTLWEKWEGEDSHNHPMFGSVVKCLFTQILGIKQKEGTSGFVEYQVQPADIKALLWAKGRIQTANGIIDVEWIRDPEGNISIC